MISLDPDTVSTCLFPREKKLGFHKQNFLQNKVIINDEASLMAPPKGGD